VNPTKIDAKFRDPTPETRAKLRRGGWTIARHSISHAAWRLTHRLPRGFEPHRIPRTFFGVNCAPNPDPAWDEPHLRWIRELGVGSVRVDVTYDSDREAFWRWVTALHIAGLDVTVHLVQPPSAAAAMHISSARAEWEAFVAEVFEPVWDRVTHSEIGSAPNRHTWSGSTVGDLVTAHEIARPILADRGLRVLGPNVQDFAPYFNAALLGELRRRGLTPDVHSDNLFVDRAGVPPERPDHRAVGRVLSPVARLTLMNKLRWLAALSRWAGCEETWVTCFAWTVAPDGSSKPRHVDPETQAAYLERYHLLAAASGLVQRVFWGQLTGHLRGLIDDGQTVRHDPPEVFLRRHNHACPGEEAKRPAFHALAALTRRLVGAQFIRLDRQPGGELRLLLEHGGQSVRCRWNVSGEPQRPLFD
jgi:hypothetical protein